MLPDFLKPKWLRLLLASALLGIAFLATNSGWLGSDVFYGQLEIAPPLILAVLIFPAFALLGSIGFDYIGSDPEKEDYSPEAVEKRIAARRKDKRSL